jgi:hypothetical protein
MTANLQTLLNDLEFESLPPEWTTFDLGTFSRPKRMWDYQQTALQNIIKALWKYYEGDEATRKQRFFKWYQDNDVELDAEFSVGKKRDHARLLAPYYPITDSKIPYQHFINRLGVWMATGSGKTLVIVKLLELLWGLMQRRLIPSHDLLVLTHREDLLKQLRDHVNEFNTAGRTPHIQLRELREYPEVKRGLPSLLGHQELTVFYYRSDNISDEQKERLIDFRNYDNNGKWYVLLDEAHKGDKDDSKRQHLYNILSRAGFLFNFSATFTDQRDILTTASEFNLASFIKSGYGKHISILKQENRAFKDKEDFTNEEKQKIVLQSLLVLAYVSKVREQLGETTNTTLYHRPLLLALVNSVNTEEADLKLFFHALERIGKGKISAQAFTAAKLALRAELESNPEWQYEGKTFTLDKSNFDGLIQKDVWKYVFNADSAGEIEVLVRPTNDKEIAFKLKSADAPFALIKIGQTTEWLKDFLAGYEIVKGFEDESFFAHLNDEDSEINLLMGSRSFYEGWDSNRPNVITFINIGVGDEARKFVLQSVGRGVRLEPLKGKRKRLENLHNAGEVGDQLFRQAKPFLAAIQSLFIFGTNRVALDTIFEGLEQEEEKEEGIEIALDINTNALSHHPLLIPVYRQVDGQLIVEQREPRKFEIQDSEVELLDAYVKHLDDDRLLLAHHDLTPKQIGLIQQTLSRPQNYFNPNTPRKFGNVDIILPRLMQYFDLVPRKLKGFKPLEDEINHFKHIRVYLKDIQELQKKIDAVRLYKDPDAQVMQLKKQLSESQIDIDQYTLAIKNLARTEPSEIFDHNGHRLHIKQIATHYYLPMLLSDDEKIDYITRIIRVPSEIRFVNQLEAYLKEHNLLFKEYDWWLFSRADEVVDKVIIPYYDPTQNRVRDFHPDFIFWLVKGDRYTILFVDPKGMTVSDYQYKIDGYEELFRDTEANTRRGFKHSAYKVTVALVMYTKDANQAPQKYKDYWYDNPQMILQKLAIEKAK